MLREDMKERVKQDADFKELKSKGNRQFEHLEKL